VEAAGWVVCGVVSRSACSLATRRLAPSVFAAARWSGRVAAAPAPRGALRSCSSSCSCCNQRVVAVLPGHVAMVATHRIEHMKGSKELYCCGERSVSHLGRIASSLAGRWATFRRARSCPRLEVSRRTRPGSPRGVDLGPVVSVTRRQVREPIASSHVIVRRSSAPVARRGSRVRGTSARVWRTCVRARGSLRRRSRRLARRSCRLTGGAGGRRTA
jgi:hypothetical protein